MYNVLQKGFKYDNRANLNRIFLEENLQINNNEKP